MEIFFGCLTLLYLFGVIVTQTRGAFLGLFFGGIIYVFILLFRSTYKKKRMFILLFTVLLALGATSIYFAREHVQKTSLIYRFTNFQDESANTRLIYWDYALRGFKENPLFGVGHQNFYTISDKYYEMNSFPNQQEWPDKPHNIFLEILVTGGIFAFLSYVFLLLFASVLSLKYSESNSVLSAPALIATLVAYCTQNVFTFDVPETLFVFIFLLAFISIQPKEYVSKPTYFSYNPILLLTITVPVLGSIFLLYPFIQQMRLVFTIEMNR